MLTVLHTSLETLRGDAYFIQLPLAFGEGGLQAVGQRWRVYLQARQTAASSSVCEHRTAASCMRTPPLRCSCWPHRSLHSAHGPLLFPGPLTVERLAPHLRRHPCFLQSLAQQVTIQREKPHLHASQSPAFACTPCEFLCCTHL